MTKANDPAKHWVGMPDFDQPRQRPFAAVNIRFGTEGDMLAFCDVTGIKLTPKTKSAWYPEMPKSDVGSKRWL